MAVCSIWQFADFTNTGNCHIEHTAICCLCYAVVFLTGLHPIANVFKAAGEAFNWTISLGNLVLIAGAVFLLQHRQTQLKALSTQAAIAGLGNYHQQLFSISPLKVDNSSPSTSRHWEMWTPKYFPQNVHGHVFLIFTRKNPHGHNPSPTANTIG